MNGNRTTALALLLTIIAAELFLSGGGQQVWKALWAGPVPLGQALHAAGGTNGE